MAAEKEGPMTLKVHHEFGKVDGVWVEGVPADFTDADVKYNIELLAAGGDKVAEEALSSVGKWWIRMNVDDPTVRVYLDD